MRAGVALSTAQVGKWMKEKLFTIQGNQTRAKKLISGKEHPLYGPVSGY
jgi:hypothetical protein